MRTFVDDMYANGLITTYKASVQKACGDMIRANEELVENLRKQGLTDDEIIELIKFTKKAFNQTFKDAIEYVEND